MNDGRWTHLAPLGGIAFVVGVIVAAVVVGDPPDSDAPARELVDFYADREGRLFGAAVLQTWAAVLLVLFAASVRMRLQARGPEGNWPGLLTMAGGVVLATGTLVDSIVRGALAEAGDDAQAQVLQTLHYVGEFTFFPLAGGVALLAFGLGSGILRTGYLPRPLGWVAIAGGALTLSPVFFVGLAIGAVAVVATAIALLTGREPDAGARAG